MQSWWHGKTGPIAWLDARSRSCLLAVLWPWQATFLQKSLFSPYSGRIVIIIIPNSWRSSKDEVWSCTCTNCKDWNMRHKLKEFSLTTFWSSSNARGQTNQCLQILGCWWIVFVSFRIIVWRVFNVLKLIYYQVKLNGLNDKGIAFTFVFYLDDCILKLFKWGTDLELIQKKWIKSLWVFKKDSGTQLEKVTLGQVSRGGNWGPERSDLQLSPSQDRGRGDELSSPNPSCSL